MSNYFGFNSAQAKTLRALLGNPEDLLAANSVTTAAIQDSAITNAKVSASAAIALSKLANMAAGTSGLAAASIQTNMQWAFTAIANLTAWATALATKLNADAGVTDTDYDTDPLASLSVQS